MNIEEGVGLEYQFYKHAERDDFFKVFTGLAARQLVVSEYYIEEDDADTDPVEFSRVNDYADQGLETGFDTTLSLKDYIAFTSTAKAFFGFKDEFWKATWDAKIVVTLTKHLGLTLSSTMIYDENVIDEVQWKTATLLTLSYQLF